MILKQERDLGNVTHNIPGKKKKGRNSLDTKKRGNSLVVIHKLEKQLRN